jgi:hypothetical protein
MADNTTTLVAVAAAIGGAFLLAGRAGASTIGSIAPSPTPSGGTTSGDTGLNDDGSYDYDYNSPASDGAVEDVTRDEGESYEEYTEEFSSRLPDDYDSTSSSTDSDSTTSSTDSGDTSGGYDGSTDYDDSDYDYTGTNNTVDADLSQGFGRGDDQSLEDYNAEFASRLPL